MNKNVGKSDKIVRFIIAIVLVTLYFTNVVTGTLGIVFLVLAVVAVMTATLNFCGLYKLVGINTCKMKK